MSWLIALLLAKRVGCAGFRRRRQFSSVLQFFMKSSTGRRCSFRWRNCAMFRSDKVFNFVKLFSRFSSRERCHSHEHFQGFRQPARSRISLFDSSRACDNRGGDCSRIIELSIPRIDRSWNSKLTIDNRRWSAIEAWSEFVCRLFVYSAYGFSTLISCGVELNELFVYVHSELRFFVGTLALTLNVT